MDCKSSSLCVFDKPGTLTDVQRSYIVDYYPVSSINGTSPIEFFIPGNGEDYIDVNDIKLYVKVKLLKADGTNVEAKDNAALANLPISTLFQDASLMIGETQIEGGHMSYPYYGYFNTVMQFTPDAQKSTLTAFGWYKDDAGEFDNATKNSGFLSRQKLTVDGKTAEFMGPLFFDFFRQDRYLISQTDLRIKLTPSKPEFVVCAYDKATDFKIAFESVILYVDRVELNPSVINGHTVGLKSHNALYPINHSEVITYTIPKGQKSYTKDRLFPDMAPKLLMVAMVENESFNGNVTKNPFHFQHFNLSKIALYREGRSVPGHPFSPDFDKNDYLRSYVNTMRTFDYYNTDATNGLTPFEWANGYTIYAYDLTSDKDIATHCRQGYSSKNLRLELTFEKDLPSTINVLLYAVFDSSIEITQLRDVIMHYTR